jgi:LacI family transcriptional regulator
VVWAVHTESVDGLARLDDFGVPVVALHADPVEVPPNVSSYSCDNAQGIDLAVEHLVQLGHTQIAFVNYADYPSREFRLREVALHESLSRRGLVNRPTVSTLPDRFDDGWRERVEAGLTAVVTASEAMGGWTLRSAAEEALWLPDQLSVIGFDSTFYCETTVPKLTAVRQPLREMAYAAVCAVLEGPPAYGEAAHRVFRCDLDIRESTAPPMPV